MDPTPAPSNPPVYRRNREYFTADNIKITREEYDLRMSYWRASIDTPAPIPRPSLTGDDSKRLRNPPTLSGDLFSMGGEIGAEFEFFEDRTDTDLPGQAPPAKSPKFPPMTPKPDNAKGPPERRPRLSDAHEAAASRRRLLPDLLSDVEEEGDGAIVPTGDEATGELTEMMKKITDAIR